MSLNDTDSLYDNKNIYAEDIMAGMHVLRTREFRKHRLTRRERQVAMRLLNGCTYATIAEALVVTISAVKWHIRNIYAKTGVTSRSEFFHAINTGINHSRLKWRSAKHLRKSAESADF